MCVEYLRRDSKYRMSFDLKRSVLVICRGQYVSLAESWDIQNDRRNVKIAIYLVFKCWLLKCLFMEDNVR